MAKAPNDGEMGEPGARPRPRHDDGRLQVAVMVDPIAVARGGVRHISSGGGRRGRRATSGARGKKSPGRPSGIAGLEVKFDAGRGDGDSGSRQGPFDGARPVGSRLDSRSRSPRSARVANASARDRETIYNGTIIINVSNDQPWYIIIYMYYYT
jgi:hypothetical protein